MTSADVQAMSQRFMETARGLPALHELSSQWLDIVLQIQDAEEAEDTDEVATLEMVLDRVEGGIRFKAESIVGLARWFDTLAAGRRSEVARIEEGARAYERRAERLRKYVLDHMVALGIPRIDTPKYSLSVRKNPASVTITNPDAIPLEFRRTKIIVEPAKDAIKIALKAGEVVPGAELQQTERLNIQ